MQSTYTIISKKIGWAGTASLPTVEEANRLLDQVISGDVAAFEQVFRINRFAPCAYTSDEQHAASIIYKAYQIGTKIHS